MNASALRNARRVPLMHPVVVSGRPINSVSVAWPNPATVAMLSLVADEPASIVTTVSALTSLSLADAAELHPKDIAAVFDAARRIA